MGKKIVVTLASLLVAVFAYIYPTLKRNYVKFVHPQVILAVKFGKWVANFTIFGRHIPWRFVLPVAGVLLLLLYIRVSERRFLTAKGQL